VDGASRLVVDTEHRGEPPGFARRLSSAFYRHPGGKLTGLLLPVLLWMVVVYLGALLLLFLSSFWRLDPFTSEIVRDWGFQNFQTIFTEPVYRIITLRTVGVAAAVTVTDIVLAFPIAYYAARMASARARAALLVAIVLPLWASYLIRVYAWRVILDKNGLLDWLAQRVGLHLSIGTSLWGLWLVFSYLWLPFVTLPIYAALERVPGSYLEASSDLGARGWVTFRRVIWPLALPGVVAGSIFAFSLTLGDYVAPTLIGNTRFIGNVVYENVGVANNVPLAAAFALVPVAIMAVYLAIARRLGAFEAL
jgi:putative spermidine/putrescine transport system permease protein